MITKNRLRDLLYNLKGPLTFGDCLMATIARENISQSEFAKILNVSNSYISNVINNKKKVSIEQALQMAIALNKAFNEPIDSLVQCAIEDILREGNRKKIFNKKYKVSISFKEVA